jgi:two-component system CAI-1 autoinducer sensor kinase/phosphatase CqsS
MPQPQASIAYFLRRVMDFLRSDYERNELTIDLIRYIALWGHPLYWLLCTVVFPQTYESFGLRFGSAFMFIPILFYKHYPVGMKPYLNLYWYLWLTFTFPVIFTYLMLMNNLSGLWLVAETVMLVVFIIFIHNFFLLFFLLIFGIWIAYTSYVYTTGAHFIITKEVIEYFISVPIAFLLGILVKYTQKKSSLAEERNAVLESLAGSIAHEMRNPLGQIRHCLSSIQNQLPHYLPERCAEAFDRKKLESLYERVAQGQMAVRRGVQVIDMVLGEIREKAIDPESFTYVSAARITRNALDEYSYESESDRRRVHFKSSETFLFHGNENLFVFVLFNLLKNAIFYFKTSPASEITIWLQKGGANNYLFFRDTGPGITKDALPHIFDSFFTSGKSGGTGLGLAYCKRVMNAFNGDIRCESVAGEYTEFCLSFPVIAEDELNIHKSRVIAMGRRDFGGKRLLIVDDEPLYRITLKNYFSPLEVFIDEASNGTEAIELLSSNNYDLVVMDLNMPSMSGYETVERMRRGEAGPQAVVTPVVAHSSESPAISRSMSENAGMQAFLAKPCTQIELINTVRAARHTMHAGNSAKGTLVGRKLLLVDDSALNRDMLAMTFRDAGLEVTLSDNGKESLEILNAERFDLLITDIHMPGMSGLELTRKIRSSSDQRLSRLPVIGLSGAVEEEESARNAGMDEFRVKTDSPNLLFSSMVRLLMSSSENNVRDVKDDQLAATESAMASYGLSPFENAEIIRIFLEEFNDTPSSMRQAIDKNDYEGLRQLAHKLKGSAAILGAESLRQAAEVVEINCRYGRTENLDSQVSQVISALREFSEKVS